MPCTSVFAPTSVRPWNSTVLTAPTTSASGSTWSSSGMIVCLSGIVRLSPAQESSRPATNAASPSSVTSTAS